MAHIIPAKTKYKELVSEFDKVARVVVQMIQTAMAAAGVDKSSNLYKSVTAEFVDNPSDMTFIVSMARHAQYVDSGRRAGAKKPPFTVIRDWVVKKKIQPQFKNKKGQFMSIDSITFIICNSISIKGIKAKPFLKESERIVNVTVEYTLDVNLLDILFEDTENILKL